MRQLCVPSHELISTVETILAERKEATKKTKLLNDEVASLFALALVTEWREQKKQATETAMVPPLPCIVQHRSGSSLAFLQAAGDLILQYSACLSLDISLVYLSGSDESNAAGGIESGPNVPGGGGGKKKKGKGGDQSTPPPPSPLTLAIPLPNESGPFILYGAPALIDDAMKQAVCAVVQGKAGGRPGRLQGSASALHRITEIPPLLSTTLADR
jgi:hypothetical protein